MTKEKTLLIIGILIIALPNFGFPNLVEKIVSIFFGLLIISLAYAIHFEKNKKIKTITKTVKVKEVRKQKEPKKEIIQTETEDVVLVESPLKKEEITGFTFIKKDVVKNDQK